MENYTKGEVLEIPLSPTFPLDDSGVEMKVTAGSKIRNLLGFSMKKIKEPEVKQMTWNASGNAISKAISCAEIMKRKHKNLHQITKLRNRRIEEYWEPKLEGLDRLKVNRDIPAISILLSKIPVDTKDPGYQAPGVMDSFWRESQPNKSAPRKYGRQPEHQGPSVSASSGEGKRQRKNRSKRNQRDKNKSEDQSDVT